MNRSIAPMVEKNRTRSLLHFSLYLVIGLIVFYSSSLAQTPAPADSVDITLTGEGFMPTSTVYLDATLIPASAVTFVNSTMLLVRISRSQVNTEGQYNISVQNQPAGGGASAPQVMTATQSKNVVAEFSIMSKKTSYHEIDSVKLNGRALSVVETNNVLASALRYMTRTSFTGKVLLDGNIEMRCTNLPVPEDPLPKTMKLPQTAYSVKYVDINTNAGTATMVSGTGSVLMTTPISQTPFKALVDMIPAAVKNRLCGDTTSIPVVVPPSSPDSNLYVKAALMSGLPTRSLNPAGTRYEIIVDRNLSSTNPLGNLTLAAGVRLKHYVNTVANNIYATVIEKQVAGAFQEVYSMFRTYRADNSSPQTTVSYTYYTSKAGTPMVHVVAEEFELFSFTNYLK